MIAHNRLLCCLVITSALAAQEPSPAWALHEWGVLTVVPGDPFAHPDLINENASFPDFFIRADPPQRPPTATLPAASVARKPVIWLHGPAGLQVDLQVDIPGGRPVIWHPAAAVGTNHLRWQVQIPERRRTIHDYPVAPLPVADDHWVTTLRRASSTMLQVWPSTASNPIGAVSMAARQAEHFLYYDAEIPAPGVVTARQTQHPPPSPGTYLDIENTGSHTALDVLVIYRQGEQIQVSNRRIPRLEPGATWMVGFPLLPPPAENQDLLLAERRATFVDDLTATGLTSAEATALVDTWWDGFLGNQGVTVIHRMPQSQYEATLPIQASPAPTTAVRVGLVHSVQGAILPRRTPHRP